MTLKQEFVWAMCADIKVRRTLLARPDAPKLRYASTIEYALFNGGVREANIMDTPLPPMMQGNCFANAFSLMLDNPGWGYVEGYATMNCTLWHTPTAHAWIEDELGMIHDPTWKDVLFNQIPKDRQTPEALREAGQAVYCGTRIQRRAAMISALLHGTVNIIEFNGGEMMNPFLLEHGTEHFDHLLNGHLPEGRFTGAVKDHSKLPTLAILSDDELEQRCRQMIADHPKWLRHPSGVGYVLEGSGETWGV
jgi:hypothetical protein